MAVESKDQLISEWKEGQSITGTKTKNLIESFKHVQDAVSSPVATGVATAFIDTITQDSEGKITVTKKTGNFTTAGHKHDASDIYSGKLSVDRIPTGITSASVALGNHNHDSDYAPKSGSTNYKSIQTVVSVPSVVSESIAEGDIVVIAGSLGSTYQDINGKLSSTFKKFVSGNHTHDASSIISGVFSLDRIPTGTTSASVALGNHTHTEYAALAHTHSYKPYQTAQEIGNTTIIDDALKRIGLSASGSYFMTIVNIQQPVYQNTSGVLNFTLLDPKLTFALVDHVHTFASITSKPTTLSGYGITDAASISHNHNSVYQNNDIQVTGSFTSNVHTVVHSKGHYPEVRIVDSTGKEIGRNYFDASIPDLVENYSVQHTSTNAVKITISDSVSSAWKTWTYILD